eukprot:Skav201969  [mRNA]  locus=scaffold103:280875:281531:+ [translate_table: standard]
MEHNSNLFGDASFLAVPAIHFFGFPGYYTASPPRLSAHLFEDPAKRARLKEKGREGHGAVSSLTKPSWLCDCLAKGDAQHLDVTFCRQENSVEDITIRFQDPSHLEPVDSVDFKEPAELVPKQEDSALEGAEEGEKKRDSKGDGLNKESKRESKGDSSLEDPPKGDSLMRHPTKLSEEALDESTVPPGDDVGVVADAATATASDRGPKEDAVVMSFET